MAARAAEAPAAAAVPAAAAAMQVTAVPAEAAVVPATAISGIVEAEGHTNLLALPRISWDGRQRSLRVMRVMLSGLPFPNVSGPARTRVRIP